jgi:hypothetical protein
MLCGKAELNVLLWYVLLWVSETSDTDISQTKALQLPTESEMQPKGKSIETDTGSATVANST